MDEKKRKVVLFGSKRKKAARRTRKRRLSVFFIVMLSITLLLLAAIGVGTVHFWRYIEAYEASRLEHIILHLQDNVDYDFWESQVEKAIASRLTVFEKAGETPIEAFLPRIREVRYVLRQKSDENTAEAPVYVIRAGARDIGIVRFAQLEDIGYGFHLWDVSSMEFLESFIDAFDRSISITASQNATITVNDIPLSEKYRIECQYDYGASFLIDGIYGDVRVSVFEFDGTRSEPYIEEGGFFLYPITIPFSRTFNIVAPEGVAVFVDGEQLLEDKVTDDRIIPGIFTGIVDPDDVPEVFFRYEYEQSGFYTEPVVTAVDPQGRNIVTEISGDGVISFIIDFSPEHKELHYSTVEAFIRAYVVFATNVGGNFDSNLATLSNHVLRGSDLHRRFQNSRGSMDWVGGTSVSFNWLEIDNFRPYGEDYFSCEVRYNITGRYTYGSRETEGSFELLYILSGGRWVALNMLSF